jgi:glycosyltransferase involved in cell wall biosynthesis
MKIGIIGTRGIPNQYGGFEQFAEKFSTIMADKGHDITVYTSHRHPYKESEYKNVRLIHCYDPEHMLSTFGQFIYDLNCIRNCRKQNFDVIFQLGYTSSTIWSWLYPKSSILVTNMDGLEWTRAKYNKATQYFLTHAEKWGVRYSNYLIADSKGIQAYLLNKYDVNAVFIPYGADIYSPADNDDSVLQFYSLLSGEYDLLIARFEPENNIETVLKSYAKLKERNLVLIGNYANTVFGRRMFKEYGACPNINFAGANYNVEQLNSLRYNSRLYLHGHSVGGTNPSLLEAMACSSLVCAHNNQFNKHVLGNDAFYFNSSEDLTSIISSSELKVNYENWLDNNRQKILHNYNWTTITDNIESNFKQWKFGEQFQQVLCAV